MTGPRWGFNWSIGVDRNGIPIASALAGANRHDSIMFEPTLESVADRGLLFDVEALHLDRGYNSRVRRLCDSPAITDVICAKRRPRGQANHIKLPTPLGMCWTVERTNSWLLSLLTDVGAERAVGSGPASGHQGQLRVLKGRRMKEAGLMPGSYRPAQTVL